MKISKASFTWLLAPVQWKDPGKKKAFVDFINWMICSGEGMARTFGYVPLPKNVAVLLQHKIRMLQ